MKKALLDTNFYIYLVNSNSAMHSQAVEHYQYFLNNNISMYLSTVVIGEFCVKGSFDTLPLKSSRILSYNLPHSKLAAQFANVLYSNSQIREISGGRKLIPNDVKLLAQTSFESIDYFVSYDGPCRSFVNNLTANGQSAFSFIDFSRPVASNFKIESPKKANSQISLFGTSGDTSI